VVLEEMRQLGKTLVLFGVLLVGIGGLLLLGPKLPIRLGRLPGDIVYRSERTTFYFPIVTSLLVSALLTLVFWLISYLRR